MKSKVGQNSSFHIVFLKRKEERIPWQPRLAASNNQSVKMNRVLRFEYHSERASLLAFHQLFINLNL